jgi:hypothetical protein
VGIATAGPKDVIDSLRELNRLRAMVAGDNVELGRVRARKRGRAAGLRKGASRNSGNKTRGRRIQSKGA